MAAKKWLRALHGFALLVLFLIGLALVYQSSLWYVQQAAWLPTTALVLVGGSCLCLSLFGQRNKSEGIIAATIVSAFWTVGAAVGFAKSNAQVEAWTLLAGALAQIVSSILGSAVAGSGDRFGSGDEEEFLAGTWESQPNRTVARNYGALSTFVDPLSASTAAVARSGPSGSQISAPSNVSVASHSPTTSPQLIGRTPSPFGTNASPHRLGPASLASLSAAATPKETPEDIKQSYKSLWEKYDLDT